MCMSSTSSQYFEQVAGRWDSLRQGYFSESVREVAIAKAYLRPQMVVADVGSGTGFMAAGLAPWVRQVHVIDASASMLEAARRNLVGFTNIVFHESDGLSLRLPENSLDAVFANMYLHHCPDPLAAIREMVRILRPGGRLIITDMDAHDQVWLKEEMADEWLGFERDSLRNWFLEAGLVNRIVDGSGQSCVARSEHPGVRGEASREARISVFVAVGSKALQGIHETVKKSYGALAAGHSDCCSPLTLKSDEKKNTHRPLKDELTPQTASCGCGCSTQEVSAGEIFDPNYSPLQLVSTPPEVAEFSLGCGNPTAFAGLKPGEVVLDIGSGGGLDSLLAAKAIGPTGKVIGLDMTPAMVERARGAAQKAGTPWVEFRHGQAEAMPIEDGSIDVVLSNCVINLTADKGKVFGEVFRVLRPGGRMEISDIVSEGSLLPDLGEDLAGWADCVTGALPEKEYLDLITQAGFKQVSVRRSPAAEAYGGVKVYSVAVSARKPSSLENGMSIE